MFIVLCLEDIYPFLKKIILHNKKFNQDFSFSFHDFFSAKLEELSFIGIFSGNGVHSKVIAVALKNYIINYFKVGTGVRVTLKKGNFYSILYNAFINAQNYINILYVYNNLK